MIGYLVAGAATVDAFALGVWVGKKWGNKASVANAVATAVPVVNTDLADIKALIASLEAKVSPVVTAVVADVAKVQTPVAPVSAIVSMDATALQAKVDAAVAAAKAAAAPVAVQ